MGRALQNNRWIGVRVRQNAAVQIARCSLHARGLLRRRLSQLVVLSRIVLHSLEKPDAQIVMRSSKSALFEVVLADR